MNVGGSPCLSDSLLNDICLSPDGRRVVTVGGMGNGSGSGELWDVRSGERIAEVDQSTGAFFCVISPDSKRFLTAGGWEIVLWDEQGECSSASLPAESRWPRRQ